MIGTNTEPARRNGPHESRKDTLLFHEMSYALTALEALLEEVKSSLYDLETDNIDITDGVEGAAVVTQNRR